MSETVWPYGADPTRASLDPPNLVQYANNPGIGWRRDAICYPKPPIPVDTTGQGRILTQINEYVINDTEAGRLVVGTEVLYPIRLNAAGAVYALSGTAYLTTNADAPVGRDPRDLFAIRFGLGATGVQHWFQSQAAEGSTIVGTASEPRYLAESAWILDYGQNLNVAITLRLTNVRVCIALWAIEVYGPSNVVRIPR